MTSSNIVNVQLGSINALSHVVLVMELIYI
jgi:hypothetical protein